MKQLTYFFEIYDGFSTSVFSTQLKVMKFL